MPPRFHCTPPELVAETVRETVFVGDYTFRIDRPVDGDKLLDHPWCRSAYVADEYVPYWPTLWPSARMLAKAVLHEPWERLPASRWRARSRVRAGAGRDRVPGRGLHVTFSDVDETALAFAAANARLNGYPDGFRTRPIDFRCPPDDDQVSRRDRFRSHVRGAAGEALVRLLEAVLAPGGVCLIADPDRLPARVFRWKLEEAGYDVTADFARAGEPGGERTKGTIYRIRCSGHAQPRINMSTWHAMWEAVASDFGDLDAARGRPDWHAARDGRDLWRGDRLRAAVEGKAGRVAHAHAGVALGAALFVVSQHPVESPDAASRVIQGIAAGIGFLGAGAILKDRHESVHGLTTAADIWLTAAIGVAAGMGRGTTALSRLLYSLVILAILPRFERWASPKPPNSVGESGESHSQNEPPAEGTTQSR